MALTTGIVRLSFCHIWEPQAPQNGQGDPKYSVTLLIPKTDTATLNSIYADMAAAEQQGVTSKWGGVKPPIVKTPLYDGDGVRPSGEPFGAECRGHMVMTASCKNQPPVVDQQVQPIINRSEVYSGCYARVNINFFAYAQNGNKGIGCGLNCVQKWEDGEPLAGTVSVAEAFGGANAIPVTAPAQGTTPQGTMPTPYAPAAQPQYTAQSYAPAAQPQYTAQSYAPAAQPQYTAQSYAPAAQPQYTAQPVQTDPITGQPLLTGGVMGI